MHLRGLDLNLLVALDALLTEQNISRAAVRINLSQSGMSTALARLRQYFEDELLVPVGRKMTPTPLAQSFMEPVRAIILQSQALINSRPSFEPEVSDRKFNLWVSDYVAAVFLPEVMKRLERLAPKVSIELLPNAAQPYELIEQGEIDMLIVPDQYLAAHHPSRALFTERYVCVSWADNEHTRDGVTVETYFALRHVMIRFGLSRGQGLDETFLQRFGQPRKVGMLAVSLATLPYYLVGTQLLATMHERMARIFADHLPLRISELPIDMPPLTEVVQWHQYRAQDPGIQWLRELICDTARELYGDLKQAD